MIVIGCIVFIAITYAGLIASFTIGLIRTLSQDDQNDEVREKLSIVVAFRDEESNLPVLLEAILAQTNFQDFYELILIDDHSTDNSLSVAENYRSKFKNFSILSSPTDIKGKKAALAYGIKHTMNPIIVFTDADCVPSRFWLEAISICAANGADFIVGAVVMNPINSFARKLQSLEYSSLMATAAGSCGIGRSIIASSANLAFRKDTLNVDANSMNPIVASGDDMFLLQKAKKLKDFRIEFLSDERAIVQTSTESTIVKALRQRKRWASKSLYYKDFDTIAAGLIVMIFNLLIVAMLFISIFNIKYLFYYLILLAIKSIVDYPLINRYLKFIGHDSLLKVFVPLQLIYPFYIVFTFFKGIFIKESWKGRSIR